MHERFTDRARKVMQLANQEAMRLNHERVGAEHILLGLAKEAYGVAGTVLKNFNIDLRKVRLEMERRMTGGPEPINAGKMPLTPEAKKVLKDAIDEAKSLGHNWVGTEHLLLGLLRSTDGIPIEVLIKLGVKPQDVRDEVMMLVGQKKETPATEEVKAPEAFGNQDISAIILALITPLIRKTVKEELSAWHALQWETKVAVEKQSEPPGLPPITAAP